MCEQAVPAPSRKPQAKAILCGLPFQHIRLSHVLLSIDDLLSILSSPSSLPALCRLTPYPRFGHMSVDDLINCFYRFRRASECGDSGFLCWWGLVAVVPHPSSLPAHTEDHRYRRLAVKNPKTAPHSEGRSFNVTELLP